MVTRIATLIVITLLACGGSSPATGPIAVEDFRAAEAAAECTRLVRCGVWSDVDTCLAYWTPIFVDQCDGDASTIGAVTSGKATYDGDKARACINALTTSTCDTRQDWYWFDETCEAVFAGTIPGGGSCANSQECTSRYCANNDCRGGCLTGTCMALPPPAAVLPAGAACASDDACVYGTWCSRTNGTCTAPAAGDACIFDTPAGHCPSTGWHCSQFTRTCSPPLPLGASCAGINDFCASGLTCDPDQHTCVNGCGTCASGTVCDVATAKCHTVGALGSLCTQQDECTTGYCNGTRCGAELSVCF